MLQKAKVISLFENGDVKIQVERASACGHDCASCSGCGMQAPPIFARAENRKGALPGDFVEIESESRKILAIAGVVYMLPLLLFFLLYILVHSIMASDAIAITAGGIGFAAGVFGAVLLNRREAKKSSVSLSVVRVLR